MNDQKSIGWNEMMRRPSAFLPLLLSLAALALLAGNLTIFGVQRQADEGTAAHLWQLLMAVQAAILLFFAAKWIPRTPRAALPVFALQIGATILAMAPVFLLHL